MKGKKMKNEHENENENENEKFSAVPSRGDGLDHAHRIGHLTEKFDAGLFGGAKGLVEKTLHNFAIASIVLQGKGLSYPRKK